MLVGRAMNLSLIVLSAGRGSRMLSDLPKVLHEIGGLPLYAHALQSGLSLDPDRVVLVTGVGADLVRKSVDTHDIDAEIVVQDQQLGTAHAVAQAAEVLADVDGDAVVLYGDTPFIRPETLEAMLKWNRTLFLAPA